ncbi:MAG: DUF2953 domain-containing protein [Lachnospiraceae bacterium]|nr:DUF2953 domain-containing protein [Lachnospiraceae bacterium]
MIALQILKIIGIILLVILGLILFLLAVILFVPIHYRADGDYADKENKYNVHARVNWILRIIRVYYDRDKEKSDLTAKVLFFKVYPGPEKDAGALGERKPPLSSRFEKIKYKISRLYDKIRRIIYMLNDERDHRAVAELLLRTKKLLWHIRPRRLDVNLKLGMGDPASTGEITGYISSFYPIYTHHLHLSPDFDNKVIEADGCLKGHIQLIFVLIAAARVYFDKDIRRLYNQIRKLKEE